MMGVSQPLLRMPSTMYGTALAASSLFTVMRTSSEPARAREATCWTVDSTSAVSVLVIDWTTTGASDPTRMPPILTVTAWRRWMDGMCSFYQWNRSKGVRQMASEGAIDGHLSERTGFGRHRMKESQDKGANNEVDEESDEAEADRERRSRPGDCGDPGGQPQQVQL